MPVVPGSTGRPRCRAAGSMPCGPALRRGRRRARCQRLPVDHGVQQPFPPPRGSSDVAGGASPAGTTGSGAPGKVTVPIRRRTRLGRRKWWHGFTISGCGPGIDQGGVVAGVELADVGRILLGVGVWALVVGATVGEGAGASVEKRGSCRVGVGVVQGSVGAVLVVPSTCRGLGFVGLLMTGVRLEGMVAAVAGRTRK